VTPPRPNIVFVLTDDQGYGDLGCHGNPYIQTPHVDALHAASVRLTNYHVGPTCSPTRAGLLTGHFHNSTGVWHTIAGRSLLRRDERTLPNYLSDAGYATALFGKWHLGDAYPFRPQDRGFQEVVTHGGGGIGNAPDRWGNNYTNDFYCHNGRWERYEGYCTDVWFRLGLDFIKRQAQSKQPFFCLITPNAPHLPHIVPDEYSRPYFDLAKSDPEAARFFGYPGSDQMLKFYGMVTCIDRNVGLLRQRLQALGLAQNTIVIFMTDNGSAGGLVRDRDNFIRHGFNAGMRGGKGTPYEGGHRVPFFLHFGATVQGRDVPTLTANVDIAPTLLELCGVPYDAESFHGRSLVPLLNPRRGAAQSSSAPGGIALANAGTEAKADAKNVADENEWSARAVVTDSQRLLNPLKWRFSCVMRQRADGEWRLVNRQALYNLRDDPEQRTDVASHHPDVVAQLRQDYEDWWRIVSPRTGEATPFPIGECAETVTLTSHDWRRDPLDEAPIAFDQQGDDARCVWNQSQVRQGLALNGYWELDVSRAGRYRFELRRWPREANLALGAGIDGEIKPYTDAIADVNGGYGGGQTVEIERAGIQVAGARAETAVDASSTAAIFDLDLSVGPTHLETSFSTKEGTQLGAFYVYIDAMS
jgi:arylsulfatase A-like enzyme